MNDGRKLHTVPMRAGSDKDAFNFVAPKPALSGEPGERIATCVEAKAIRRGRSHQVVLFFESEDGQVARMYIALPEDGRLTSTCRYARLVRLALGRDPVAGKPVHPGNIFVDKTFRVDVGFRKTEHAKGKGGKSDELSLERKDAADFLRIHDLLELLDP